MIDYENISKWYFSCTSQSSGVPSSPEVFHELITLTNNKADKLTCDTQRLVQIIQNSIL